MIPGIGQQLLAMACFTPATLQSVQTYNMSKKAPVSLTNGYFMGINQVFRGGSGDCLLKIPLNTSSNHRTIELSGDDAWPMRDMCRRLAKNPNVIHVDSDLLGG